jgi:N-acetylglucosamine-6-sulfatase
MPETPPNIVLILVDDADAKVLQHAASQRIRDKILVDHGGATATRYLNTHPLCGPSRASILRGMYPQNTKVNGNSGARNKFETNGGKMSNIARWLKNADTPYRTGMIGKYLNGYQPVDDEKPDLGFDYWFGVGHDGYNGFDFWAWDDYEGVGAELVEYTGLENHLTDILGIKARQFLDDEFAGPFFLMISTMAPHSPATPAFRHREWYPSELYPTNVTVPPNRSFNEVDVSDKPYYIKYLDPLLGGEIADIHDRFRDRLRCMESVADLVEDVFDKLEQLELIDNTYVFFTSDHGFHMGEHRLGKLTAQDDADGEAPGGKNSMYEEDIRVPLWVCGPGVEVETVDQLVGNVDLAPTFCDIAGIDLEVDPPDVIDGRSFLPLLAAPSPNWRTQFMLSRGQGKPFVGFRHAEEWAFAVLFNPAAGEVPGEVYNLYAALAAAEPTWVATVTSFALDYGQCAGDTCRMYDSAVIPPIPQI